MTFTVELTEAQERLLREWIQSEMYGDMNAVPTDDDWGEAAIDMMSFFIPHFLDMNS